MVGHIDFYYRFIAQVFFVLTQAATGICLVKLCRQFMEMGKRIWLIGSTYLVIILALYYIPAVCSNFFAYSTGMLSAFLVMLLLERKHVFKKIFLIITYFAVRWLGLSLVDSIYSLVYPAVQKSIAPRTGQASFLIFVFLKSVHFILTITALYFPVHMIGSASILKESRIGLKECCMLTIPSASGMICYAIMHEYNHAFEREVGKDIFCSYSEIKILWIINDIVFITAILIVIFLFQNLRKIEEENKSSCLLQQYLSNMQSHIEKVERIQAGIRGVNHDIKNHINVMQNLLERGNLNETKEYLGKLQDSVAIRDFAIKTGNPVTDVIINEKAEDAAGKGIAFLSDYHFPEQTEIDAFDLSIILYNALENAIAAAEGTEHAYVNIRSSRRKNIYLLTITNSFAGEIQIGKEDGLPVTGKPEKEVHGFGLRNIKSVAAKYFGDMEFEYHEHEARLTVMLQVG